MPSPRAVLTDIEDLNLDPTKSYTTVSSTGRLKHVKTLEAEVSNLEIELAVTTKVEPESTVVEQVAVIEEVKEIVVVDVPQELEEKPEVLEKKEKKSKKKLSSESESS